MTDLLILVNREQGDVYEPNEQEMAARTVIAVQLDNMGEIELTVLKNNASDIEIRDVTP